ncbi:type II secretion system protein GspD, partial [Pseudomonas aeruginosa]|nr:type II secretion system protein GspD [Pseudomonas aeruginosa]
GAGFADSGLSIGTLLGALQAGKPPAELPDGAIVGLGSRDFGALVTALSRNSRSNLLSTPSLLTLDNQKAEILVGQNVPFQTGSYTTSASGSSNPFTTVERKDIGVTLKVTPHIGEDRMLRLEIEQEISSIAPTATLAAKAVDLVTNKRSIKSTVLADDGQVIVLGGLIQDDLLRSDSRVPLLGDIPGVGRLFRSSRETRVKRNLMVFLRPSIVRDAAGLERISHGRYRSIQLLRGAAGEPVRPLFEDAGAIDLRPAAQFAPATIGS